MSFNYNYLITPVVSNNGDKFSLESILIKRALNIIVTEAQP